MLEHLKKKLVAAAAAAEDLFNSIKLPEAQRNERLAICKACPHLSLIDTCNKCGCYMPAKTYLSGQSCPIGKWVAVSNTTETTQAQSPEL
jgi:hypothetical protein